MRRTIKLICLLALLLIFQNDLVAQLSKEYKSKADMCYNNKDYPCALENYEKYRDYLERLNLGVDSEVIRRIDELRKKPILHGSSTPPVKPPELTKPTTPTSKKDSSLWLIDSVRNKDYPDSLYYKAFVYAEITPNLEVATDRARMDARSELAHNIQSKIKSDIKQTTISSTKESESRFEKTISASANLTLSNAKIKTHFVQSKEMVYAFAYLERKYLEDYYITSIQGVLYNAQSEINRGLTKNGQKEKVDSLISEAEVQIQILSSINSKQEKTITFRECVAELRNRHESIIEAIKMVDARTKKWYHYINSPFTSREQFYGAQKTINSVSLWLEGISLITGVCYLISANNNYRKHENLEASTLSKHNDYYDDYKQQRKTGNNFLILGVGVWFVNAVLMDGCDIFSWKKKHKTMLAPTILCDANGNLNAGLGLHITF